NCELLALTPAGAQALSQATGQPVPDGYLDALIQRFASPEAANAILWLAAMLPGCALFSASEVAGLRPALLLSAEQGGLPVLLANDIHAPTPEQFAAVAT